MTALVDRTGHKYKHWIVISRVFPNGSCNFARWLCRCKDCGLEKVVYSCNLAKGSSCPNCMLRKGKDHHAWKGGRKINAAGYISVLAPEYPHNDNEHILVASKALGRPLKRGECVHHIDEDKGNNVRSNLVVCTHWLHKYLHKKLKEQNCVVS